MVSPTRDSKASGPRLRGFRIWGRHISFLTFSLALAWFFRTATAADLFGFRAAADSDSEEGEFASPTTDRKWELIQNDKGLTCYRRLDVIGQPALRTDTIVFDLDETISLITVDIRSGDSDATKRSHCAISMGGGKGFDKPGTTPATVEAVPDKNVDGQKRKPKRVRFEDVNDSTSPSASLPSSRRTPSFGERYSSLGSASANIGAQESSASDRRTRDQHQELQQQQQYSGVATTLALLPGFVKLGGNYRIERLLHTVRMAHNAGMKLLLMTRNQGGVYRILSFLRNCVPGLLPYFKHIISLHDSHIVTNPDVKKSVRTFLHGVTIRHDHGYLHSHDWERYAARLDVREFPLGARDLGLDDDALQRARNGFEGLLRALWPPARSNPHSVKIPAISKASLLRVLAPKLRLSAERMLLVDDDVNQHIPNLDEVWFRGDDKPRKTGSTTSSRDRRAMQPPSSVGGAKKRMEALNDELVSVNGWSRASMNAPEVAAADQPHSRVVAPSSPLSQEDQRAGGRHTLSQTTTTIPVLSGMYGTQDTNCLATSKSRARGTGVSKSRTTATSTTTPFLAAFQQLVTINSHDADVKVRADPADNTRTTAALPGQTRTVTGTSVISPQRVAAGRKKLFSTDLQEPPFDPLGFLSGPDDDLSTQDPTTDESPEDEEVPEADEFRNPKANGPQKPGARRRICSTGATPAKVNDVQDAEPDCVQQEDQIVKGLAALTLRNAYERCREDLREVDEEDVDVISLDHSAHAPVGVLDVGKNHAPDGQMHDGATGRNSSRFCVYEYTSLADIVPRTNETAQPLAGNWNVARLNQNQLQAINAYTTNRCSTGVKKLVKKVCKRLNPLAASAGEDCCGSVNWCSGERDFEDGDEEVKPSSKEIWKGRQQRDPQLLEEAERRPGVPARRKSTQKHDTRLREEDLLAEDQMLPRGCLVRKSDEFENLLHALFPYEPLHPLGGIGGGRAEGVLHWPGSHREHLDNEFGLLDFMIHDTVGLEDKLKPQAAQLHLHDYDSDELAQIRHEGKMLSAALTPYVGTRSMLSKESPASAGGEARSSSAGQGAGPDRQPLGLSSGKTRAPGLGNTFARKVLDTNDDAHKALRQASGTNADKYLI
ncbi:unnamed protein product [Amoebophrya sp. A120]|nr:unnamed protein product [Amoebophrya sp. A120]|eukprot:GSA120T00005323001.1